MMRSIYRWNICILHHSVYLELSFVTWKGWWWRQWWWRCEDDEKNACLTKQMLQGCWIPLGVGHCNFTRSLIQGQVIQYTDSEARSKACKILDKCIADISRGNTKPGTFAKAPKAKALYRNFWAVGSYGDRQLFCDQNVSNDTGVP